jgi:uncharacterized protein (TIGR02594 family)
MLAWNKKPIKDNLPNQYKWLADEPAPKILIEMLKLHGIQEVAGDGDNPLILSWAEELGAKVGIDYKDDATPWCGLVMGIAAQRAGYEVPDICVRASSWLTFGNPVFNPNLGDIIITSRPGGNHVSLYTGHDKYGFFHSSGGNQSDQVNISRISMKRIVGIRRCPWKIGQPKNIRPIILAPLGHISENEA